MMDQEFSSPAPELSSPWLNLAGSLGLMPPPGLNWPEPIGAFITSPLSFKPRSPAETRAVLPYPGGVLMHTGLPNPGLRSAIRQFAARWARLSMPVWVHLVATDPDEIAVMVRACEALENVQAIEVGLPPQADAKTCLELVEAAAGELPVIAYLELDRAGEIWLDQLERHGAGALSLGPPRGTLNHPGGKWIGGRLYGQAIYPLAMEAVRKAVRLEIPIIASGGIYSIAEGRGLLQAGAWAVALDTCLWL